MIFSILGSMSATSSGILRCFTCRALQRSLVILILYVILNISACISKKESKDTYYQSVWRPPSAKPCGEDSQTPQTEQQFCCTSSIPSFPQQWIKCPSVSVHRRNSLYVVRKKKINWNKLEIFEGVLY